METFRDIKAGDRVRYRTAQGQVFRGRACALLLFPEHVVLAGNRGQAVVVNASNYISHRRGPVKAWPAASLEE